MSEKDQIKNKKDRAEAEPKKDKKICGKKPVKDCGGVTPMEPLEDGKQIWQKKKVA
ncbi:MAG: hypothetical protein GY874_21440 [Desulfobacteraceae bacterium]|nr:hypothetical protein [Desulfobacteraceae bacterium]